MMNIDKRGNNCWKYIKIVSLNRRTLFLVVYKYMYMYVGTIEGEIHKNNWLTGFIIPYHAFEDLYIK